MLEPWPITLLMWPEPAVQVGNAVCKYKLTLVLIIDLVKSFTKLDQVISISEIHTLSQLILAEYINPVVLQLQSVLFSVCRRHSKTFLWKFKEWHSFLSKQFCMHWPRDICEILMSSFPSLHIPNWICSVRNTESVAVHKTFVRHKNLTLWKRIIV